MRLWTTPHLTQQAPLKNTARLRLKALRPMLSAVVDREDHDIGFLDGIRKDERRIRIDQLTGPTNPACSSRHRVDGKLLNAADDLHRSEERRVGKECRSG